MFRRASLLAIGEFVVLIALSIVLISYGKHLDTACLWLGVVINDIFSFLAFKPLMPKKNKEETK